MGDWIDVAWSLILDQAPLMSDAARWRKAMHEALWLGQEPTLTAEERKAAEARKAEDARQAIGTPVRRATMDEMRALMERARELREGGQ